MTRGQEDGRIERDWCRDMVFGVVVVERAVVVVQTRMIAKRKRDGYG